MRKMRGSIQETQYEILDLEAQNRKREKSNYE